MTITAVCLVVVTFAILALGISLVLFRNCGRNVHTELNCEATEEEAEELMELVPHITLNPSFNIDMLEYIEAEVSPTDACERTNLVQVASNDVKSRDVGLIWLEKSGFLKKYFCLSCKKCANFYLVNQEKNLSLAQPLFPLRISMIKNKNIDFRTLFYY